MKVGTLKPRSSMTYIPYEVAHPREAGIQRGLSSAIGSIGEAVAMRARRNAMMKPTFCYNCIVEIECFKEKPENFKNGVADAKILLKVLKVNK